MFMLLNLHQQERDTKVRFAPEPAAVREVESTKDPELWYSEAVCKLLALQKAHDTLVAQTLGCSLVSFYDFTRWVQQVPFPLVNIVFVF